MNGFNFYYLFGSLGLFFLGMTQLEKSLKNLTGRNFKVFLQKNTGGRLNSICSGALVTAILQSSSLVSLITLAFIGSGLLSLQNAIGVIIGANLGTTLTGWFFTFLGFKLNISNMAMTFLGIGSFFYFLLNRQSERREIARLLMGFGLLFYGLDGMKSSISSLSSMFNLELLQGHSIFIYFLSGFIITAIIQSSSACMVIVLSALNAGIINFTPAAAIVLGADLGTTLTIFLGAINGSADKKRLALSHFLYNLIVDLVVLILLPFLVYFITDILNVKDALIGVVLFHSIFNFLGILIFFPFIEPFAKWVKKKFSEEKKHFTKCRINSELVLIDEAIELVTTEIQETLKRVLYFNTNMLTEPAEFQKFPATPGGTPKSYIENYHHLKTIEGEIFDYALHVKKQKLEPEEAKRLEQLLAALRSLVYSAKGIKDIHTNLIYFHGQTSKETTEIFNETIKMYKSFYELVQSSYEQNKDFLDGEFLLRLKEENTKINGQLLENLTQVQKNDAFDEVDLSTYFNLLSELHTSGVVLLRGVENLLLDKSKSAMIQEHTEII